MNANPRSWGEKKQSGGPLQKRVNSTVNPRLVIQKGRGRIVLKRGTLCSTYLKKGGREWRTKADELAIGEDPLRLKREKTQNAASTDSFGNRGFKN